MGVCLLFISENEVSFFDHFQLVFMHIGQTYSVSNRNYYIRASYLHIRLQLWNHISILQCILHDNLKSTVIIKSNGNLFVD